MTAIPLAVSALVKLVYSSLVAGIGISVVFSIAVFGAVRASDARRENRDGAATAYVVLAACGLLASTAMVVYGLVLVAHKS